jgi:hypothetical protein
VLGFTNGSETTPSANASLFMPAELRTATGEQVAATMA